MTDGGKYYVFASNTNVRNVPVRTVTDLTRTYTSTGWEQATSEAMPTRPSWARQDEKTLWAPTVAKLAPNFYVMYFAANRPNAPQPWNPQCIGRAFASLPQGPYTPETAPITCGIEGTGAQAADDDADTTRGHVRSSAGGDRHHASRSAAATISSSPGSTRKAAPAKGV